MVAKKGQKSTTSKSKKTEVKSEVTPELATEVAPEQVKVSNEVVSPVTASVTEPTEPLLSDAFTNLLSQLVGMRSTITSLSAQIRSLKTRSEREIKLAKKAKKRRNPNKSPSGFVKPALISIELASFLGKPNGSEMARTEVTREINSYIREHKLQDPANGRRILPDAKLRKLLKINKTDELTYFNLQRYMSPHFPKKAVVVAPETS